MAVAFAAACAPPAASPIVARRSSRPAAHPGKPPIALIARDGDPAAGVAMAVVTDGIAPARSTTVAWSLAALVEARLTVSTAALDSASAVPTSDGFRVRGRARVPAEVTHFFAVARAALASPVTAAEAEAVATAARTRLAVMGPADPATELGATCRGATLLEPGPTLDTTTLEGWRAEAYALGRVSLAVVGRLPLVHAGDEAVARDAVWPALRASLRVDRPLVPGNQLYVRTAAPAEAIARVDVAVATATSAEAVALASTLGDPATGEHGALAARLGALDRPALLTDVTATAHPGGGCVGLTITVPANDVGGRPSDADLAARIGAAVAVTTQEVAIEAAALGSPRSAKEPTLTAAAAVTAADAGDGDGDGDDGDRLARAEGDARDAADLAAWWTLADTVAPIAAAPSASRARATDADAHPMTVVVGVAADPDTPPATPGHDAGPVFASLLARVGAEVDRARAARGAPVAELHAKVEHGQGETWVLVESPCAGVDETASDAGLAAAATLAETMTPAGAATVTLEPFIALDGVGIIAHDRARAGESPAAAARRIADAAARRFAATPLDAAGVARARSALFTAADTVSSRALATIADAVSPGRPSWLVAQGTTRSLGRASDAEVIARAAALRTAAVRVAILASDGDAQITAAAQAVDRWMIRRPEGEHTCPHVPAPPPPRPGTYVLSLAKPSSAGAASTVSAAWLALPLTDHDRLAFADATWLAAALDGPGGLLDHALTSAGLVRSATARVVGSLGRGRAALVVHLESPGGALDAAVAQTRALLDRLRQGALVDADLARATARHAAELDALASSPRGRLLALARERDPETNLPAPTLLAWRAFAASSIKDDALIISVTASPAHPSEPPPGHR